MKYFILVLLAVFVMACGGEEKERTSGEIYCDAVISCMETNSEISFEDCVEEYDSNLCSIKEEGEECFRGFSSREKECLEALMKPDTCGFWEWIERSFKDSNFAFEFCLD